MNYLKNVYHRFTYEFYGVPESYGEMLWDSAADPWHVQVTGLYIYWTSPGEARHSDRMQGNDRDIKPRISERISCLIDFKRVNTPIMFFFGIWWLEKSRKRPSKIHHISGECTSFHIEAAVKSFANTFIQRYFNKFTMKNPSFIGCLSTRREGFCSSELPQVCQKTWFYLSRSMFAWCL